MTKLEELKARKDMLKIAADNAYHHSVAAFSASEDADEAYDAALQTYQDALKREAEE